MIMRLEDAVHAASRLKRRLMAPLIQHLETRAQEASVRALFDPDYYLAENPEVRASGVDPLEHYLSAGWKERRNPNPLFDIAFYLRANPDVAAAGVEPLQHYLASGWREHRDPHPSFQAIRYLDLHDDVKRAEIPPLLHYLTHGLREHRATIPIKPPRILPLAEVRGVLPIRLPGAAEPAISVIIPVRNQADLTLRCLHSLANHATRHPFEVIVIDDGSDEETRSLLQAVEGLTLVKLQDETGFVAACNAGAAAARGAFLHFLNNDTVVLPGALDELRASFDTLPEAGAVGSALIFPDGRLQEAGARLWSEASGANIGREHDPEDQAYCFAREADYCSAASLMIRTALFRELGGFDPIYAPAYYEDADLCLRVRARGLRVYCQPASRIVHVEGGTAGTDLSTGFKRFQALNRTTFAERWAEELARRPAPRRLLPWDDPIRPGQRRMLILDHALPTAEADAGSVVLIEIIRRLQHLGYVVAFGTMTPVGERNARVRALERMGVEVIRSPYVTVRQYIDRRVAEIDVVLVVRYVVARYFETLLPAISKRLILNADLHYLRGERMAAVYGDEAEAQAAREEKQAELKTFSEFGAVVVHSTAEQELLRRELPGRLVEHLPWIVRPAAEVPGCAERRDFLFVGGFDHAPNVDAMVYFVTHLWPRLRERMPDAELRIVGSKAGAAIRPLDGLPGVNVVGFVPDLAGELARARVAIAPLRWGAGFKGKVATAMAAGLPGVLTPIAAEGMGLADGEHVLIAELGEAFLDRCQQLATDPVLWARLSAAGLALAAREWSPERAEERLIRLLHRAGVRPTAAISDGLEERARAAA